MKIPVETKPAFWGAIAGAVVISIVGFKYGGWVTGGTAEADAVQRSKAAVVVVLAPICADRFKHAADASNNLIALKKTDSWSQGDFVVKGGWATMTEGSPADQVSDVAKACATLLTAA